MRLLVMALNGVLGESGGAAVLVVSSHLWVGAIWRYEIRSLHRRPRVHSSSVALGASHDARSVSPTRHDISPAEL